MAGPIKEEVARLVCVHATKLSDADIDSLSKAGSHIVHCPESNLKLASGFCEVAKLRKAGINVALGTDGCASNNDLDMWEEMRLAALLQKVDRMDPEVMSAKTVLGMATRGGAEAIGLDDKVGSIEIGKRADIIQVSFDDVHFIPTYDVFSHLVYVADEQDVASVTVDGKVLMVYGEMRTIDTERVRSEARALAARIQMALTERNADR